MSIHSLIVSLVPIDFSVVFPLRSVLSIKRLVLLGGTTETVIGVEPFIVVSVTVVVDILQNSKVRLSAI